MRSRSGLEDAHGRLQRELHEERAAALLRIAGTLERILEELRKLMDAPAVSPEDHQTVASRRQELLQKARRYRWYLEVQREAIGLRDHRVLDEFYPLPARCERGP